ncbi:MAG: UvrD-helicase domain-containing protein [Alphaproteobacteria bacterium]|nr:UvrD-helicase domain-containing protein [Alphaproteobacteria bacterium]
MSLIKTPETKAEKPARTRAEPPALNKPVPKPLPRPEKQKTPAGLDQHQLDAVKNPASQLLIVAGPGSGKTSVLTSRISHMVSENIMPAENCLAITFTRRAAEEMRNRLKVEANIHTFHSLCFSILKENCEIAGLAPDFQIDDAVTFDDLINITVRLFKENPAIVKSYQNRFKYVSVDEYQDIDEKQYELIRLLAPKDGYLCAIGDPNQAIYGFRGGDSKFFKSFAQDYPGAATVNLKNNYRSTGTIVDASNQMIEHASVTAAFDRPHDKITIHTAPTDKAEAEFVVKTIENLIGGHNFHSINTGRADGEDENLSFSDFAVLYRSSSQLQPLTEALGRSGMPFARLSGDLLCENKAVKKLLKQLADGQPVAGQLDTFDGEEHIRQFLLDLAGKHPGKAEFIRELSLLCEIDTLDQRADRIALMTLHASKGLEFKCVFIVGLEDGLLPFHRAEDVEEERRLLYVGMTRAQQRLYLTRAVKRKLYGTWKIPEPSPFLEKIEQELLNLSRFEKARQEKDSVKQLSLF